jgi:hypothetical protein
MKKSILLIIAPILSLTSCATVIKTQETKFYYPTYRQWKSLDENEMEIVNDFTFKNNYIAPEYSHLKKISFNKRGRRKLAEIRNNKQ